MVHALQQARSLLRPGGLLVNVNDLPAPDRIEVHLPDAVHKVGWLLDEEDSFKTRSAFNALAWVVDDGSFILEDERDFAYQIYSDGLSELQEWLAEWWESALLTERMIRRIQELERAARQPARIVLALRPRMTKLRAA